MGIGIGSIVAIGLKLVANREKIAQVWADIEPAIEAVRRGFPKVKDLIEEIVPKGELPEGKQVPETYSVEWLQESLNTLGADPVLVVDGDYGEATKEAVMQYQQDHGLTVDGWAGVATQASIAEELAKQA